MHCKDKRFYKGVFVKIGDFIKFKGFSCGIPREQAILRKSKPPENRQKSGLFLSLAFYNAPSLDTVEKRRFWTPTSHGTFSTPLRCSFGGVQKLSEECVLWYVFLPPYWETSNHTPPCSSAELVFAEKKWGPQRKDFGGRYGFPGFYRALYPPPAWKVFFEARKVLQKIFFRWWLWTLFSSLPYVLHPPISRPNFAPLWDFWLLLCSSLLEEMQPPGAGSGGAQENEGISFKDGAREKVSYFWTTLLTSLRIFWGYF